MTDDNILYSKLIIFSCLFLSLRKHKANTTELHPKVRQTYQFSTENCRQRYKVIAEQ